MKGELNWGGTSTKGKRGMKETRGMTEKRREKEGGAWGII